MNPLNIVPDEIKTATWIRMEIYQAQRLLSSKRTAKKYHAELARLIDTLKKQLASKKS